MNQLTKVRYDKQTTHLDTKEERYWMHFLQGDPLIGAYIRSQMRHNPQFRRELYNQPVCSKCEKFAFHHKEGVMCPTCGHWTPSKTHKVMIHMKEGHYR